VSFDLDNTLNCGQTFRWCKRNDKWYGVVNRQPIILRYNKEKKILEIESNSEEFSGLKLSDGVSWYLGLNDSLETIKESGRQMIARKHPAFLESYEQIFDTSIGIRILRQDPLEMLIEYLLSTQSSILTIKRRVELLSSHFLENRTFIGFEEFFLFPTVDQLKGLGEDVFKKMKFGYRSRWLKELVEKINEDEYRQIKNTSLEHKIQYMIQFNGIGYKVANCVALFGFSAFEAFPVDVWISRFLEEFFDIIGNSEKLMHKGREIFGKNCGYIQEYIFFFIRNRDRKVRIGGH
jgi:N-glycosylase/DNA lyase